MSQYADYLINPHLLCCSCIILSVEDHLPRQKNVPTVYRIFSWHVTTTAVVNTGKPDKLGDTQSSCKVKRELPSQAGENSFVNDSLAMYSKERILKILFNKCRSLVGFIMNR